MKCILTILVCAAIAVSWLPIPAPTEVQFIRILACMERSR